MVVVLECYAFQRRDTLTIKRLPNLVEFSSIFFGLILVTISMRKTNSLMFINENLGKVAFETKWKKHALKRDYSLMRLHIRQ